MNANSLQQQHLQMLLKYSGISFISGAVNHGFFTIERSMWTALAGIVLFVAGAWMEHRHRRDQEGGPDSLWGTLLWGTLLSIGLGLFTGGLQHFPDSPARSAWVVPLGFAISAAALVVDRLRAQGAMGRSVTVYLLAAGALTVLASVAAWQWYEAHPPAQGVGAHHHGHGHAPAPAQVPDPGAAPASGSGPGHGHSHGDRAGAHRH